MPVGLYTCITVYRRNDSMKILCECYSRDLKICQRYCGELHCSTDINCFAIIFHTGLSLFSQNILSPHVYTYTYEIQYKIYVCIYFTLAFVLLNILIFVRQMMFVKKGVFSFNTVACFLKYLQVCPFNKTSYLFTCISTEMCGASLVIVVTDF